MIVIKTVLKSGGIYTPEHVERIRDMVRQHVKCPYKFVCYSDLDFPLDGELRTLKHAWPSWWSKMEIFREAEPSFYIDLDMTITADITSMVTHQVGFMALRNMNPSIPGIGSALMRWDDDMRWLYSRFAADPTPAMRRHQQKGTENWGDQGYIWEQTKEFVKFYQDAFPRRIKKFCDGGGDIRVYFGRWKPWGTVQPGR